MNYKTLAVITSVLFSANPAISKTDTTKEMAQEQFAQTIVRGNLLSIGIGLDLPVSETFRETNPLNSRDIWSVSANINFDGKNSPSYEIILPPENREPVHFIDYDVDGIVDGYPFSWSYEKAQQRYAQVLETLTEQRDQKVKYVTSNKSNTENGIRDIFYKTLIEGDNCGDNLWKKCLELESGEQAVATFVDGLYEPTPFESYEVVIPELKLTSKGLLFSDTYVDGNPEMVALDERESNPSPIAVNDYLTTVKLSIKTLE